MDSARIAHPLAVGGTGGGVAPSQAQNVNQLQQRQQQIQHQIQSTQRRLGELRQAEEEARRRMGSLQQNIRQTESSLRDNQYRLEQAQKALEQAQKELQELEDRLRRQQQGTAARLRYMQRQGDIVISVPTARAQAKAQGHRLSQELAWLASHGLLHLLGWDHPDELSLQRMLQQQRQLLAAIQLDGEVAHGQQP